MRTQSGRHRPRERYLRYDRPKRGAPGLGHSVTNLKCLMLEASNLGRQAIVPPLTLHPDHNFLVDNDWQWETYYDLSAGRLLHMITRTSRPLPIAKRPPAKFGTSLTVHLRQRVPRRASAVELIVRHVAGYHATSLPRSVSPNTTRLWLPPSATVADLARPVIERLRSLPQGYAAVHARRTDRLNWGRWAGVTAPERIRAKLRQHGIGRDTPVFFLSDERDPAFWAALRGCCRMYRYLDFPHLADIVSQDGQRPDNYLLFVAEQEIMRHARLRIGTAWGPERPPADDFLLTPKGIRRPAYYLLNGLMGSGAANRGLGWSRPRHGLATGRAERRL